MGKRLLPFRQYNEHDVINMFALDDSVLTATQSFTETHSGDAGVFVKVTAGNLNDDPVKYDLTSTNSYLGKTNYPFVGNEGKGMYPSVTLKVAPASSGDIRPLGLTLWETAKYDENGQKLIYYPQKAYENQVLLPGQSVPVATKGIFTLTSEAYTTSGGKWLVGNPFVLSATAGKVSGVDPTYNAGAGAQIIGTILATGSRGDNGATIADKYAGNYAMIKLNA
jgi:hypothetical protein